MSNFALTGKTVAKISSFWIFQNASRLTDTHIWFCLRQPITSQPITSLMQCFTLLIINQL